MLPLSSLNASEGDTHAAHILHTQTNKDTQLAALCVYGVIFALPFPLFPQTEP